MSSQTHPIFPMQSQRATAKDDLSRKRQPCNSGCRSISWTDPSQSIIEACCSARIGFCNSPSHLVDRVSQALVLLWQVPILLPHCLQGKASRMPLPWMDRWMVASKRSAASEASKRLGRWLEAGSLAWTPQW